MSVLPPIEEEFVAAGQVKVEVRPIAILGEESALATQAAECANDQGRFWEYHDVLYANQAGEHNAGAFSSENLKRFAGALDLDEAAFATCLDSGKYAAQVRNDTEMAFLQGVDSTPTTFVGDQQVASDLESLRTAIQDEIASGQ